MPKPPTTPPPEKPNTNPPSLDDIDGDDADLHVGEPITPDVDPADFDEETDDE